MFIWAIRKKSVNIIINKQEFFNDLGEVKFTHTTSAIDSDRINDPFDPQQLRWTYGFSKKTSHKTWHIERNGNCGSQSSFSDISTVLMVELTCITTFI